MIGITWRSINLICFIHVCLIATRDTVPVPMTREQVQQCKQDLTEFYRTNLCKIQTDPLDLNTLLALDDIFTSLTLVEEVLGKEKRKPIAIENLLQTEVNGAYPKRLLLQGEGGAGKTTLCSKIAWEWVNGRHFTEFEMVLFIPLRTSRKRTVGDIAKSYMSDSNFVEPKQIDAYILANPDKVFLLFDGFDELDAGLEDTYDTIQIITLKRFKSCKVLATSRPWKADLIRKNPDLRRAYAFITVEGFSKANISAYIHKFFTSDTTSAAELIQLMEDSDVISENMAPFPIYTAMLCHMWKHFNMERRKAIHKLQTFSQLFDEMIGFLMDHYISKGGEGSVLDRRREVRNILVDIGEAAFKGLQESQMILNEKYFTDTNVIGTGCKFGVITQEKKLPSRREGRGNGDTNELSVVFPHKLFQEYIAGLYLEKLYMCDRRKYDELMTTVIRNYREFKHLLYFTSARDEHIGLDLLALLIRRSQYRYSSEDNDFLVDMAFECHKQAAAKLVWEKLLSSNRTVTISRRQSAHTVYGHLFIMEDLDCQMVKYTFCIHLLTIRT